MPKNKLIVTGAAGFIGFHLCKSLLKDNYEILGLDDINSYYDVSLKNDRLNILQKKSNFTFSKLDIADYSALSNAFINFKPNKVINLAAQAGVRYSINNPFPYVKSNLVGFVNIIELCKENNIEGLIYASSSSVYGSNDDSLPFSVNDVVNKPISIYAATKLSNELIAHSYSHLYNLNTTGLRFFTVYGPWGRPDMAYYSFTENISKGKSIRVYNNGKMKRDFTYIDDIIRGIRSAIDKNYYCEIFNLGNNKSVNLLDFINCIENELNLKAKIKFVKIQKGEVKSTYANIEKSIKMLDYKPNVDIEDGIKNFVSWYNTRRI